MPCRSDYMEPNEPEKARQRSAKALVIYWKLKGVKATKGLKKDSEDPYCANDHAEGLCLALNTLSEQERDELLYSDAKDKDRRFLAMWYEDHVEADNEQAKRNRS